MSTRPPKRTSSDDRTLKTTGRDEIGDGLGIVIVYSGGVETRPIPSHGSIVVGRAPECDLTIDDPSVSRKHVIVHSGRTPSIEDAGSTNGTRIGERRLAPGERVPLTLGTVVELGGATLFVQRATAALLNSGFAERETTQRIAALDSPARGAQVKDPTTARIYRLAEVVARSALPVLILGETGVGKEVLSEHLHARSPRADQPLLRLNCAAFPEAMLEGELFGYERGSFTGAVQAKEGLFESAHRGSVLLDEIGEMPLATQAKLLRVLESGEVMRLGSVRPRKVDVRIIAATNRDLELRIAEGLFRADLFYRVNAVTLTLPPLRDRPDDIVLLATYFVEQAARKLDQSMPIVSDEAIELLKRHRWPGNVRELRNVMNRAVLLCMDDRIEAEHLTLSGSFESGPPKLSGNAAAEKRARAAASAQSQSSPVPLRADVQSYERERIIEALDRCAGNQSRAAEMLGMPRRTFIAKLDAYGVARPRKRVPRGG